MEPVGNVHTDEWGSNEDAQEGAEIKKQLAAHCVESDEEEKSPEMSHNGHTTVSETRKRLPKIYS